MPIARFASGLTVLTTVAELLPDAGSAADVLTVAELVTNPSSGGPAGRRAVPVPPMAKLPRLQVTTPWNWVKPPAAVAETNVNPAGRASVTWTALAAVGPRLVATMM